MEAALNSKSGARRSQKLVTYYNLGLAYRAMGDISAAESAFSTVVSLATRHEGAWIQLAYIALDRRRPEEAMSLAERAAVIGGQGFHYRVIMGMAAMAIGDVPAARRHARLAIKTPWQDQTLFCLLGDIAAASDMPVQKVYFDRRCPLPRQ